MMTVSRSVGGDARAREEPTGKRGKKVKGESASTKSAFAHLAKKLGKPVEAPKPKPVRSPAASSAVRVTSRVSGEDDEGSFEASEETFSPETYLRDVPAPVRRSEEPIADPPTAAPESPPSAVHPANA